jgi:hypothetical protein
MDSVETEALSLDTKWRKLCSETLSAVWKIRDAWIFHDPVVESPELTHEAKVAYITVVKEPMDFRTIRKNIPAFESPYEFESDMSLVFQNCTVFNKPGQDAYEMGKDVERFFLSKWQLDRRRDMAIALFSKSVELAESVNSNILITSRKRGKIPSPTYDPDTRKVVDAHASSGGSATPRQWRDIIKEMMLAIRSNQMFAWFQLPVFKYTEVSEEVKMQYYQVIKSPMDFETIIKNIELYPSPGEFRKDLELIVTNSVRFNPPGSPVNVAALELQRMVTELFDVRFKSDLNQFRSLSNEWPKGVKKIAPDQPPVDYVKKPPAVLRIKRSRVDSEPVQQTESLVPTTDEPVANPTPSPVPPVTQPVVQPQSSILLLDRPMTAPQQPNTADWKYFALHCLNELGSIKEDGNRLCWIFQKPIHQYELPVNIKRLYLLSITERMDWATIQNKLMNGGEYDTTGPIGFEKDVQLMLDNCLVFNDESQLPHKVGFVLQKHFHKYWFENLRSKCLQLWDSRKSSSFACMMALPQEVSSGPNWDDLRQQVTNEIVRPNQDCDTVSSQFPLNDELLYEWRVSQRFVMQKLRNKIANS